MDNQILMENYLLVLKSTTEVYVHGTLESSNESVRTLLKNHLNSIMTSQADTYSLMTKYGWYKVNNVDTTKIQETLNKLENL